MDFSPSCSDLESLEMEIAFETTTALELAMALEIGATLALEMTMTLEMATLGMATTLDLERPSANLLTGYPLL